MRVLRDRAHGGKPQVVASHKLRLEAPVATCCAYKCSGPPPLPHPTPPPGEFPIVVICHYECMFLHCSVRSAELHGAAARSPATNEFWALDEREQLTFHVCDAAGVRRREVVIETSKPTLVVARARFGSAGASGWLLRERPTLSVRRGPGCA
jgi:hypothetical protein